MKGYVPGNIPPAQGGRYRPNPDDLGQGTRALGFLRPATLLRQDNTGGGTVVQKQLQSLQGPQVWSPQAVNRVSLRGTGVYMAAQMMRDQLQEFNKRTGAAENPA